MAAVCNYCNMHLSPDALNPSAFLRKRDLNSCFVVMSVKPARALVSQILSNEKVVRKICSVVCGFLVLYSHGASFHHPSNSLLVNRSKKISLKGNSPHSFWFSFRTMQKFVIILICLSFSLGASANRATQAFFNSQSKILEKSYKQWMCTELRGANPSHFNCSKNDPRKSKAEERAPKVQIRFIEIDITSNKEFENLYFPENDCSIFLTLKSLGDLYFPLFEKKLDSQKVSRHFKYLSLVLTGLNPNYSDDSQRSGMWALDYLAARSLHLKSDSLTDERRGGDFTADAVSKYLAFLSEKFDGDEAKMLIAYKYGVGYIRQLTTKLGTEWKSGLRLDEIQFLKFYQYTVELFEQYQTSNQLKNYFDILGNYENLFFPRDIQYDALVDVLKLDEKKLRDQNPVYTGNWISSSARRVPFILDQKVALSFKTLEDSIYNWKPAQPVEKEEIYFKPQYHKVKRGETLGGIASKYHVNIGQLKKWNNLKGTTIFPGQKLKVKQTVVSPPSSKIEEPKESKDSTQASGSNELIDTSPKIETKEEKSKPKSTPEKKTAYVSYTVKSGDSLWIIASKYKGVSPEDIMKWNKCNEKIRPGQVLKIHKSK